MAKFTGHNSAIAQETANVCFRVPFIDIISVAASTSLLADTVRKAFNFRYITIPTLPAGVDYVVPAFVAGSRNVALSFELVKLVNFGKMAGTTWTGTAATMGTAVEGGATNNIAGPILCVVEAGLGATGGNLTVTYVDQDGNTAEAGSAQALTNSSLKGTAAYYLLNGTDTGARSVSTVTRSTGTGDLILYGVYPISMISIPASSSATAVNNLSEVGQFSKLVGGDKIAILNHSNVVGGTLGFIHFIGFSNT